MFNERRDGVKYLIATDAIGMGMNLNIDRVVFCDMRGGRVNRGTRLMQKTLSNYDILQIAGRAGRFNRAGHVSAFKDADLKRVKRALSPLKNLSVNKTVKDVDRSASSQFMDDLNLKRSYAADELAQFKMSTHVN